MIDRYGDEKVLSLRLIINLSLLLSVRKYSSAKISEIYILHDAVYRKYHKNYYQTYFTLLYTFFAATAKGPDRRADRWNDTYCETMTAQIRGW